MNTDSTTTPSSPYIPKASCIAAVLSALPLLWLILFVEPNDERGFMAFCLSVSLAVIAFVLGMVGLFVARLRSYSIAGLVLGGVVILVWGFLLMLAIIAAMIALP